MTTVIIVEDDPAFRTWFCKIVAGSDELDSSPLSQTSLLLAKRPPRRLPMCSSPIERSVTSDHQGGDNET
jgi:hypothetical protein